MPAPLAHEHVIGSHLSVLIVTSTHGTEMAFYVLMCREETAHSLTSTDFEFEQLTLMLYVFVFQHCDFCVF